MAVSHRNNIFVASSGSSWSRGGPRDCGIVNLVPPPEKLGVNADIDPRDQQPNKGEPQQTPLPPIDEPKPREAKHGGISQHRRKRIKQLYLLRCVMRLRRDFAFLRPPSMGRDLRSSASDATSYLILTTATLWARRSVCDWAG